MTENIFSWGNYEENPKNIIGVDTIATQKDATWQNTPDGAFTGNMAESFFTNEDKYAGVNISGVVGQVAKELVYGKGYVIPGLEVRYITNAEEYSDATKTDGTGWLYEAGYDEETVWAEGMAWAVAIITDESEKWLQITANGTTNGVVIKDVSSEGMPEVNNMFKCKKYLIVDKGEVFINGLAMDDVTKINFIAVA